MQVDMISDMVQNVYLNSSKLAMSVDSGLTINSKSQGECNYEQILSV